MLNNNEENIHELIQDFNLPIIEFLYSIQQGNVEPSRNESKDIWFQQNIHELAFLFFFLLFSFCLFFSYNIIFQLYVWSDLKRFHLKDAEVARERCKFFYNGSDFWRWNLRANVKSWRSCCGGVNWLVIPCFKVGLNFIPFWSSQS